MERSTTLMKIAFRLYDKCVTELTDEEKNHVNDIYEDFY
jgi:hypothetical protein